MKKLRPIKPVTDMGWFEDTDIRIETTVEILATPAQVFDCLADHDRWSEWFSPVKEVTHIGPRSGVGARRRVRVPPLTVDESFLVWDEPTRYTFTATAINLPIVSEMAEDWQLQETPTGTKATNIVAANLPTWLRPFTSVVRFGMSRTTSSGPNELKRHVESMLTTKPPKNT